MDSHDEYKQLQEEQENDDFPDGVCYHGIPLEQECSKCYEESNNEHRQTNPVP